jgi:hypothetical protein
MSRQCRGHNFGVSVRNAHEGQKLAAGQTGGCWVCARHTEALDEAMYMLSVQLLQPEAPIDAVYYGG